MKKIISILLVAMLIISMFPATALTASAATEIVFNLGNNGSAAHKDGSSAQTTYTETVGGYTLSITNGAKMYPASYDAKGNSCIKLGNSSAVGGFSFTVPSDVTGVKIEVAQYKANTSKINVNGTAYTLTKASDNGEYDAIEVSTLSNKTVSLTTVSGGVRAMVNTITFVIDSGTSCDHSLTETIPGVAATCTEPGVEEAQSCVCGENKVGGAAIDPLGHNYVNGVCDECGFVKPAGMTPATTLVSGEYVIVAVDEEGNYALPLEIASKMNGVEVTIDDDGMLTGENLPVWTVEVTADGITLFNGTKYLGYGSSTDLAAKDTAFTWTATADNGAFVIKDAGTSERCVIFQVRDTQRDRFRYGAYKTGQTSGKYVEALTFYPLEAAVEKEPVVEMDGVQYGSFEEAYQQDPDTPIKLLAPLENVDVTGDLYLDLNGFVADVDNAKAVYAYDSTATATAPGTGKLTTTAPVIVDNTVNGVRYIALKEQATRSTESTYTFHVLELELTHVTLRASEAGLYYKAVMKCDEVLAAATECHGLVVSINNMPGADFAAKEEQADNNSWTKIAGALVDGNLTSCSVFGIFKLGRSDNAARGEMKIYANAYVQLKDEAKTILVADNENVDKKAGIGYSLKDVMEALNVKFPTLDMNDEKQAEQRKTILDFYKAWPTAMNNWEIGNIMDAA